MKEQGRVKADKKMRNFLFDQKKKFVLKQRSPDIKHEEIAKISILNRKMQQKNLKMRFQSLEVGSSTPSTVQKFLKVNYELPRHHRLSGQKVLLVGSLLDQNISRKTGKETKINYFSHVLTMITGQLST